MDCKNRLLVAQFRRPCPIYRGMFAFVCFFFITHSTGIHPLRYSFSAGGIPSFILEAAIDLFANNNTALTAQHRSRDSLLGHGLSANHYPVHQCTACAAALPNLLRDGTYGVGWLWRSALCLSHSASIFRFMIVEAKVETRFQASNDINIMGTRFLGSSGACIPINSSDLTNLSLSRRQASHSKKVCSGPSFRP